MSKKIELWEGYEVEVNESLLDDFDFVDDFNNAIKENDMSTIMSMYFALVGGEDVYQDARAYLIEKYGHVSIQGLSDITAKLVNLFPKAGNRAQRRSWQTTK